MAALAALIAGVAQLVDVGSDGPGDRSISDSGSGGGNANNNGDGAAVGTGNTACAASAPGAVANCQRILTNEELTDAELRRQMAGISKSKPAADGPYPFVVVDTGSIGLVVRTGPEKNDEQFGSAANRSILWVDCQRRSSFDPAPTLNAGPVWLKIHWPKTTGTQWAKSQPKDPAQGWVYRGYTIPVGHDGSIRSC